MSIKRVSAGFVGSFVVLLILTLCFHRSAIADLVTSTWVGGAAGNWNVAGNWSNSDSSVRFPNNAGADQFNVLITPVGGANVTVNSDFTIQGLTLNSLSSLDITTNNSLALRADGTNDGIISLNDTDSLTTNFADLVIRNDITLNGTGKILFASDNQNRITRLATGPNRLTLGANQTIFAGAGMNGSIGTTLVNNGKVEADGGSITFADFFVTNNNLIYAHNGATLIATASFLSLDNTNGTITVDPTSLLKFTASPILGRTVIGGVINGGGTVEVNGDVTIFDGTGAGGMTLDNLTINVLDGPRSLRLLGTFNHNSTIHVNDANPVGGNDFVSIEVRGDVVLNGTGAIIFDSPNQNAIGQPSTGGHSLTLGANQIITTSGLGNFGSIDAVLINNGVVDANNGTILLNAQPKTNNNLFRARNGGTLEIGGIPLGIDNTNGVITINPTSKMDWTNSTITGGVINGGGTVNVLGALPILNGMNAGGVTLDNVTVNITQQQVGTNRQLDLRGTIHNNGTFRINDMTAGGGFAALHITGNVTVDGTGSILFDSPNENSIFQNSTGIHSLTIGANQTLASNAGNKGTVSTVFINNGVVDANGGTLTIAQIATTNNLMQARSGGALNVNSNVTGTGHWIADGGKIDVGNNVIISTTGNIDIFNGGELELSNTASRVSGHHLTMDNTSIIDATGRVFLTGNFRFAMTDESKWFWADNANNALDSALQMSGGVGVPLGDWDNWASLEIGGTDFGTTPATPGGGAAVGFTNNFDLTELIIGPGAHVRLTDFMDNGNRNGAFGMNEALYVDTVRFLDTTGILNTFCLNLYFKTLIGNPNQIIDDCTLQQPPPSTIPEPSTCLFIAIGLIGVAWAAKCKGCRR